MADGYNGVFGAIPYALWRSDSWLFRAYVVVSTLVALAVSLLVLFALIVLIGNTAQLQGGSLTVSRAFYVIVGLFVVGPLLAPTLLVARRHRRGFARADHYDALLALAGFLFLGSLYVGLVITVPPAQQTPGVGPAVEFLYALPAAYGLVPPLVCALLIAAVHRYASARGE
ncbi:hypothetical protein [Halegenticoccus tardaugens]|uniref:hypothetical protein n=1 Tax=Halegenticoccus tardaugens TaxID=2071624 RepID=UPI00100B6B9C|nr:hypothetical protein [Halegenticoccus tardaugens]